MLVREVRHCDDVIVEYVGRLIVARGGMKSLGNRHSSDNLYTIRKTSRPALPVPRNRPISTPTPSSYFQRLIEVM